MYRFLNPILVSLTCWLVLPLTPDVRCMDQEKIIDTMNELLVNPGWKSMNVIVKEPAKAVVNSGILYESTELDPAVTKENVGNKLRLMSIVLSCKYAEILLSYVEAIRLILVERIQNTTSTVTKWMCFTAIMMKIKNIQPLLVNMVTAVKKVNHMDVRLTVLEFERDLETLMMDMNVLYEEHGFVEQPLPDTVITHDLLDKMYKSFTTAFDSYFMSTIGFLADYCHAQIVPNNKTFGLYYINSQPSFTQPTNQCDFLSSNVDSSIEKNLQLFYKDLGFK